LEVAERVYVLDGGRLVQEGTPSAIAEDPRTREAYLGIS